jgi:hypothetical protein
MRRLFVNAFVFVNALTLNDTDMSNFWWQDFYGTQVSIWTPTEVNAENKNLTSSDFKVEVNQFFPWKKKSASSLISQITSLLMIVLAAFSGLIMMVWGWYMMLARGDDSMLTKWKQIFLWWIIAMVVALSAYYIVLTVQYILYW